MASRPSKTALKRKVYSRAKRAHDLETHVSRVTVEGTVLVDIRDYVPSTKQYGRGVSFSVDHLQTIIEGLGDIGDDDE